MQQQRLINFFTFVLPVFVAAYLVIPHLSDSLWYDEAFTIEYFSSGFFNGLSDYRAPNNHIAFSVMFNCWLKLIGSEDSTTFSLRLFPFLLYLTSVSLLAYLAYKIRGRSLALICSLLFCTLHVTNNFALQLRGYGPSWVFVLLALIGLLFLWQKRTRLGLSLYGLGSTIALGIVPTNVIPICSLIIWYIFCSTKYRKQPLFDKQHLYVMCLPACAFVFYARILSQLLGHASAGTGASDNNVLEFYTALFWPLLRDNGWILIVGVLLLGIGKMQANATQAEPRAQDGFPILPSKIYWLMLILVLVLLVFLIILPNMPPPRVTVPMMPLWVLGGGLLFIHALQCFKSIVQVGVLVLTSLVLVGFGYTRESDNAGYLNRHSLDLRPQDLYDQFYHQDFYPVEVTLAAIEAGKVNPGIAFYDEGDVWSIKYYFEQVEDKKVLGVFYKSPELDKEFLDEFWRARFFIIAYNSESAKNVAKTILSKKGEAVPHKIRIELLKDTGFFKLYRWHHL